MEMQYAQEISGCAEGAASRVAGNTGQAECKGQPGGLRRDGDRNVPRGDAIRETFSAERFEQALAANRLPRLHAGAAPHHVRRQKMARETVVERSRAGLPLDLGGTESLQCRLPLILGVDGLERYIGNAGGMRQEMPDHNLFLAAADELRE